MRLFWSKSSVKRGIFVEIQCQNLLLYESKINTFFTVYNF